MKIVKVLPLLVFLMLLINVSIGFSAETRTVKNITDPEKAESSFSKSLDDKLEQALSKRDSTLINKQVEPYLDSQLHWAARHNKPKTVKALLEKGADPELVNKFGNTPLHEAAQKGFFMIIQELVQHVEQADRQSYIQLKNFDEKSSLDLVQNTECKNYLLGIVRPEVIQKKIKKLNQSLSKLKEQLDALTDGLNSIKANLKKTRDGKSQQELEKYFSGKSSHTPLPSLTRKRVFQAGKRRPSNYKKLSQETQELSLLRERESLLATIKLYKEVLYILKKKAHEKIKLGMLAKSLGIRKGSDVSVMGKSSASEIVKIAPQELEEEIKNLEANL